MYGLTGCFVSYLCTTVAVAAVVCFCVSSFFQNYTFKIMDVFSCFLHTKTSHSDSTDEIECAIIKVKSISRHNFYADFDYYLRTNDEQKKHEANHGNLSTKINRNRNNNKTNFRYIADECCANHPVDCMWWRTQARSNSLLYRLRASFSIQTFGFHVLSSVSFTLIVLTFVFNFNGYIRLKMGFGIHFQDARI